MKSGQPLYNGRGHVWSTGGWEGDTFGLQAGGKGTHLVYRQVGRGHIWSTGGWEGDTFGLQAGGKGTHLVYRQVGRGHGWLLAICQSLK